MITHQFGRVLNGSPSRWQWPPSRLGLATGQAEHPASWPCPDTYSIVVCTADSRCYGCDMSCPLLRSTASSPQRLGCSSGDTPRSMAPGRGGCWCRAGGSRCRTGNGVVGHDPQVSSIIRTYARARPQMSIGIYRARLRPLTRPGGRAGGDPISLVKCFFLPAIWRSGDLVVG